jgi:hypothetical protein
MKKLLLTALTTMAAVGIYAQGSVLFNNSSTTLVKLLNPADQTLSSAPVGSTYTVGIWWAAAGTTDEAAFAFTGVTTTISPAPGRFTGLGKTITQVPTPGGTIAMQIRGWQTDAGSYDAAAASSDKYFGSSSIFSVATANPLSTPPGTPTAIVPGFTGLTLHIVPEPSTIALGLLGLAGLFVLRRRS